jgi:hypothetical protein
MMVNEKPWNQLIVLRKKAALEQEVMQLFYSSILLQQQHGSDNEILSLITLCDSISRDLFAYEL